MKIRVLFILMMGVAMLMTHKTPIYDTADANSRITTKSKSVTPSLQTHPESHPNLTPRKIPFKVCNEFKTWVRPSETEQITKLQSLGRFNDLTTDRKLRSDLQRYWTDNVFLLTAYGLSALQEPIFLSGLWTVALEGLDKCHQQRETIEKINSGQLAEVWLLQGKVSKIKWQGNRYVMLVEPSQKGVQFIQFPRVENQASFTLEIVNKDSQKLTTLSSQVPMATAEY